VTTQSKSLGSGPAADVAVSNDGLTVYASYNDGYVRSYDIRTGAVTHAWHVGTDLGAIDLSPGGSLLGIVEDHILGTTPDPSWGTTYIVGAYTLDVASGTVNTYTYHTSTYEYSFFDVGVLNNNSLLLSERILPGWSGWVPMKELNLGTGSFTNIPGEVRQNSWLSPGVSGTAVYVGESNISDASMGMFRTATGQYTYRGNYADNISGFNSGVQAYSGEAGLSVQVLDQHAYVFNDNLQLVKDLLLDSSAVAAAFNAAGTHLYLFENSTHSLVEYATADWSIVQTIDAGGAFNVSSGHYASQLIVGPQENYFVLEANTGLFVLGNPAATDGTSGPDILSGTLLDDTLNGLGGDDVIAGYAGADHLNGGDGNDSLDGGGGNDSLDGGADNDVLKVSGLGNASATGGTGSDKLVIDWSDATTAVVSTTPSGSVPSGYSGSIGDGGSQSVDYTGIESFDITTGPGNDVVRTGGNADILHLGDGDDTLTGGAGADTLDGGAGIDTVDYSAETGSIGVFVNLRTTEIYGASDAFGPQRGLDTYGSYDSLLNIENVRTGGGNDSVYGDAGANRIETGAGADYLNGGGGNDQLDGGAGNDVLTAGIGHAIAAGGDGTDLLFLNWSDAAGPIVLNAPTGTAPGGYAGSIADDGARSMDFTGIESFDITTGSGTDVVRTGGNDDTVHLGAGDDVANGGGGGDHLFGDAGDDVLSLSGIGHAFASGGADYDRVVIDWNDAAGAITSSALNGTALGGYSGSIGDGGARSVDFTGIESFDITTGSGNDVVRTGGNNDVVHLGAGDDVVYLGSGGDTADGGAGTDGISVDLSSAPAPVVWNLTTNSYSGPVGSFTNFEYFLSLVAGTGNDRITTSTQTLDDLVYGGAGADIITVYSGHDAVDGGLDSDLLVIDYSAASAAVTVSGFQPGSGGGPGWQGLVSDGGSHGVFFDNIERLDLTTGSGDDFVSGASDDDAIRTGLGADTLLGGAGNDLLDGGAGADTMVGGQGDDIFYVDNAGDVVTENDGEGNADEVRTSLTGYVLPANVEKLTWIGAGAGDVRGNALDNVLTGGAANDFVRAQDGGNDTINLGGGNDAVYFGAAYTSADSVDGGSESDIVALQGDYAGGVTLGTLTNVETLAVLPHDDNRFGGGGPSPFSYSIVAPDAAVAAGTQLLVNASTLGAGENLTFDGHAETNGSFFIYGGKGVDTLTGGAGADVFFFAEDGRFAATDHVDGGAGQDIMVLRGNYSLTLSGTSMVNVETVVVMSGSDARFYATTTKFSYDIATAEDTVAAGQTMTFNGGRLALGETLHFDGSAEHDGAFRLFGGNDADTLIGGAGNDLLYGGLGNDDLTGGGGADVFRYQGAGESSSTHFDTITGFTYGTDHIDLPFAVSGFADHQAVGQVDFATFDTDVARLVDSELNPFGAIELTTHGGDVGDRFFLVVDADGDGAYHANLDYVIELPNVVVPPAPDLFI
jgi:Ca2+-binding RTX toxin-like protein